MYSKNGFTRSCMKKTQDFVKPKNLSKFSFHNPNAIFTQYHSHTARTGNTAHALCGETK